MRQREMIAGYLFISPWLIGMVQFLIANIYRSFQYSFNNLDFVEGGGYTLTPVGFFHFDYALNSHVDFVRILTETLTDVIWNVPLIIFFSLFIAVILNRKFPLRGVVRCIFFLPVVMATDAISDAMAGVTAILAGGASSLPTGAADLGRGFNFGFLIGMLIQMGMPVQMVLYVGDAIGRIVLVIRQSGIQIIIFLAALQAIPPAMYEVSQIEGATGYEAFWKITLPLISPLILTNVVYTMVDSYENSGVVFLADNTAFNAMNFGLSSAMSLISSAAVCLILFVVTFVISRFVFYQGA
jgi:ABC-type sugar transport system permease subunit